MRKGRRLLGFIFLTFFSLSCYSAYAAGAGSIPVGTTLPAFKLEGPPDKADQEYLGLKGSDPFTLSQVSGKLVIIDFLSVLWPACHKAAPIVNRLYNAIKEDPALSKDIKMMGVAGGNDNKQIAVYKKQFRVSFPIVPDKTGDVFQALAVPGTPYMIMTTKEGKVLFSHGGGIENFDQMLKEIREIHKQQ